MNWPYYLLAAAFFAAFGGPVKADDFDYKCRFDEPCTMIARAEK